MSERLSLADDSLLGGYAENIQRYEFALEWCRGRRVLDAGAGSGYGAHYLASHGARTVLGVDISSDAVSEASARYQRDNLGFELLDLERIASAPVHRQFETVVNLETLPHLREPDEFMKGVKSVLTAGGTFIASVPNGEGVAKDSSGKPLYQYQHKTYTAVELQRFLSGYFSGAVLHGHWLTHQGRLRKLRAREMFEQLVEAYYNPFARAGRFIKRLAGKPSAAPPVFSGEADSYSGDYAIAPLDVAAHPWPPTTLIAVCKN